MGCAEINYRWAKNGSERGYMWWSERTAAIWRSIDRDYSWWVFEKVCDSLALVDILEGMYSVNL